MRENWINVLHSCLYDLKLITAQPFDFVCEEIIMKICFSADITRGVMTEFQEKLCQQHEGSMYRELETLLATANKAEAEVRWYPVISRDSLTVSGHSWKFAGQNKWRGNKFLLDWSLFIFIQLFYFFSSVKLSLNNISGTRLKHLDMWLTGCYSCNTSQ